MDINKKLDQLTLENENLRKKISSLEENEKRRKQNLLSLGNTSIKVFLGRSLDQSLKLWLEKLIAEKVIPVDETADLAAAIVRRVIRIGIISLLVALVPTTILVLQTILLSKQNSIIVEQNQFLQSQTQSIQEQILLQRGGLIDDFIERINRGKLIGFIDSLSRETTYEVIVVEDPGSEYVLSSDSMPEDEYHISIAPSLIRIQIPSSSVFHTASTAIHIRGQQLITSISHVIMRNRTLIERVEVIGHTDNIPPGRINYINNHAFAADRAANIWSLMTTIIDPHQLEIYSVSRGEHLPIDSRDTREARARNRRVEINIIFRFDFASSDYARTIVSAKDSVLVIETH